MECEPDVGIYIGERHMRLTQIQYNSRQNGLVEKNTRFDIDTFSSDDHCKKKEICASTDALTMCIF